MRRLLGVLILLLTVGSQLLPAVQDSSFPSRPNSLKFAVIGDTGTGDRSQYEVGQQMTAAHMSFPFDLVLMVGDNMYGRQDPQDYVTKFRQPYAALLRDGVLFRAALGNHDSLQSRFYP